MSCFLIANGKVYDDTSSTRQEVGERYIADRTWNLFVSVAEEGWVDKLRNISSRILENPYSSEYKKELQLLGRYLLYAMPKREVNKLLSDRNIEHIQTALYEASFNQGTFTMSNKAETLAVAINTFLKNINKLTNEDFQNWKNHAEAISPPSLKHQNEFVNILTHRLIKQFLNEKQQLDESVYDVISSAHDILIKDLAANADTLEDAKYFHTERFRLDAEKKIKKRLSFYINFEAIDNDIKVEDKESSGRSAADFVEDNTIDNRLRFSKRMHMLISSIGKISDMYGKEESVDTSKLIYKLYNKLAGLPVNADIFKRVLAKVEDDQDLKSIYQLIFEDSRFTDLIPDFVRSFGIYNYEYYNMIDENKGIYFNSANQDTLLNNKVREIESTILQMVDSDKFRLVEVLKHPVQFASLFTDNPTLIQAGINFVGVLKKEIWQAKTQTFNFDLLSTKFAQRDFKGALKEFAYELIKDDTQAYEIESTVFNADGKRIFPYSRHSNITTVASLANYYANLTAEELENEVLSLIEEQLESEEIIEDPEQWHNYVYKHRFPQFYQDRNNPFHSYMFENSLWKNEIHGEKNNLKVVVISHYKNQINSNTKAIADMNEQELLAAYIRGELSGIHLHLKHSDRSIFYGYRFDKSTVLHDYKHLSYQDKRDFFVQQWNKTKRDFTKAFVSGVKHLTLEKINDVFTYDDLTDAGEIFDKTYSNLYDRLTEENMIVNDWVKGVIKDDMGGDEANMTLESMLSFVVLSSRLNFLEEFRFFHGNPAQYSSYADMGKRLGQASSTGNPLAIGPTVQKMVDEFNQELQDVSGRSYFKAEKAKVTTIITADQYRTSKELVGLKELLQTKTNQNEADRIADAYTNIDSDNAASYINLFEAAEYFIRAGKMTPTLKTLFKFEAEVLAELRKPKEQRKTLAKLYDTYKDEFINNYQNEYGLEDEQIEELKQNPYFATNVFSNLMQPLTAIKPQYHGRVEFRDTEQNTSSIQGGIKTAFMVLQPSLLLSVGKEDSHIMKLHDFMIDNGIGIKAPESAFKFGHKGFTSLYDADGRFNPDYDSTTNDVVLPYEFMKDQLDISSTDKKEIPNSSQQLNNIIANLQEDPNNETLVNHYKHLISGSYKQAISDFEYTMQTDENGNIANVELLKEKIRSNLRTSGSPQSVLNAVDEAFKINDISLDRVVANSELFVNTIMSVIRSSIVKIPRSGNAFVQMPIGMFESENLERNENEDVLSSKLLNFYTSQNGKLKEADVIISIPQKWITPLLNRFQTDNIFEAVDRLNRELRNHQDITLLRGFRIPHQEMSSSEVMRVKKFLYPTTANLALVPDGITVKTGSDFDVDKLFAYIVNVDNNLNAKEYYTETNEYIDRTLYTQYVTRLLKNELIDRLIQDVKDKIEDSQADNFMQYLFKDKVLNTENQMVTRFAILQTIDELLEAVELKTEVSFSEEFKKGIESLADEYGLMDFETFSNLPLNEKNSKHANENETSRVEAQILLNNPQHLLSPVDDSYLKKDILNEMKSLFEQSESKDYIYALSIKLLNERKNMPAGEVFDITTQARKKVEMVDSKQAVGVIAVDIPVLSMIQNNGLRFAQNLLHFDEGLFGDSIKDPNGRYSTRALSMLLTSQVDALKDPYAAALNLNLKTLGVVVHLVARGMALSNAIKFINQPAILNYLKLSERTFVNQNMSKKDDIRRNAMNNMSNNTDVVINESTLNEGILKAEHQMMMLEAFYQLEDLQSEMIDWKAAYTPHRLSIRNTHQYDIMESLMYKTEEIFDNIDELTQSEMFGPIFQAARTLKTVKAFVLANETDELNAYKASTLLYTRSGEAEKLFRTMDNEFLNFLIAATDPKYTEHRKKIEDKKILDEMYELKKSEHPLFSQFILTRSEYNLKEGKQLEVGSIRLVNSSGLAYEQDVLNDYVNELKESHPHIYEHLVYVGFIQTGKTFNRYNIFTMFDNTGLEVKVIDKAIKHFRSLPLLEQVQLQEVFIKQFFETFPEFLPSKTQLEKIQNNVKTNTTLMAKLNMQQKRDRKLGLLAVRNGTQIRPRGFKFMRNYSLVDSADSLKVDNKDAKINTVVVKDTGGKGTNLGDAKDQAMRKVADGGVIVEITEDGSQGSSSLTSLMNAQLTNKDPLQILLYSDEKIYNIYDTENIEKYPVVGVRMSGGKFGMFSAPKNSTVMLARNGKLANQSLQDKTKHSINEANKNNVHFVVGDMPNVDSQFIEYLIEIGASFSIYTTSNNEGGRIATQMPELWQKVKNQSSSFTNSAAVKGELEAQKKEPKKATKKIKIQVNDKKLSRYEIMNDSKSMYLFTDNAQRTSSPNGTENVDKNTWYYKKYKALTDKPISYGTENNPTSALMRGLQNAYPITVMKAYGTNWNNSQFQEFKQIVDDEIAQIKKDLRNFDKLVIPNDRIGRGGAYAKLPPALQNYLDKKLMELGINNMDNETSIISPDGCAIV